MTESSLPVGNIDVGSVGEAAARSARGEGGETPSVSFQDVLRETIRDVDKLQHDAETAIKKMAVGESDSVAEVMTAVEKADLAFRTLMQVRNKLVDAYEELMRMRF